MLEEKYVQYRSEFSVGLALINSPNPVITSHSKVWSAAKPYFEASAE